MSGIPVHDEDTSEEISVLIRTLRDADQRLDELTAGEVDSVADRDGRAFLLHRAQDDLRYTEAAKQAAILNALPAHIVLLDSQGMVVSVNSAWRQTVWIHALMDPNLAVGYDYLSACDDAQGDGAADARKVALGIRAVLTGSVSRHSCEYAWQSAADMQWFLLTVTPLNDRHPGGAVVMYLNITEQKHGEERSRRFGTAMDAIVDAIFLIDRSSMRFIHVNDAACRIQNKTRSELLASSPESLLGGSRAELEHTYDALIDSGAEAKPLEILRRRSDGTTTWIELRRQAQYSEDGWTIITLVRDITERKIAQDRIAYLNRVYAMLSGINMLIVREHNRDELCKEACRIAVDDGGFRLSMMAIVNRGSSKIVPLGLASKDEKLLATFKEILAETEGMPTPMTVQAIREKRAIVSNDSQRDRRVAFGKRHSESGVRSMAVFPLLIADEVVGVLSLYADESQFFHEEEVKLLMELTNDVAFAIDHIEKKERLDYLAYYDVLTGLANRSLFTERVTQSLRRAGSAGFKLALLLIDLQRFRNINESLGRSAGDALLRQVAEWLTQNAGGTDILARVGVDHFAVILPEMASAGDLPRFLEKITSGFLNHSFLLNGGEFRIGATVGIALFPEDGSDVDTLFKHAEAALKKAKMGGDRYLFYTQKMTAAVADKLILENQLYRALERDQFLLYYQPKVHLASGRLMGAEALIRWNDPKSGLVLPGRFIPILEETGLIHEVGRWALRKAIDDYLRWCGAGLAAVRIAVNVSPVQLRNRSFVREIERAIAIDARAAAGLELEITESLIMENIKDNIDSLHAIRAMGVPIAIDDFGTGFSSLSYLAKLPVHALKIDRSFVTDMVTGPEGLALVSTIVKLAHSLKLNVVAEGVETKQQSRLLKLLKCDEIQGYLISKPLSSAGFEAGYLGSVLASGCGRESTGPL
jgi:diguanylate cyclase (GGDEF)-like protein/PAS domain S-box-containing protein